MRLTRKDKAPESYHLQSPAPAKGLCRVKHECCPGRDNREIQTSPAEDPGQQGVPVLIKQGFKIPGQDPNSGTNLHRGEDCEPQNKLTFEALTGHTPLFTQVKGPTHTSLMSMPTNSYLLVAGRSSKERKSDREEKRGNYRMLCAPQHLDSSSWSLLDSPGTHVRGNSSDFLTDLDLL